MSVLSLAGHQPCPEPKKIWNREYAARRLAAELERLDRDSSYRFSVLLVEVAGFSSSVASRLGHATRNDIWPKVLTFLTSELGPKEDCCRLGEDEFLLILPTVGAKEAGLLAEQLRQNWESGAVAGLEIPLDVTVAVGASFTKGDSIRTLFAVADHALSEEKQRRLDEALRENPHVEAALGPVRRGPTLTGNS